MSFRPSQFNRLAKATGGRTLYGRNDVDAEIGTAIQDGSSFYTLSYRPTTGSDEPRKFRRIVVTLDRPELKVITREDYYPRGGQGRVDPQNPSRRPVGNLVAAGPSSMVYDGLGGTELDRRHRHRAAPPGPGAGCGHL